MARRSVRGPGRLLVLSLVLVLGGAASARSQGTQTPSNVGSTPERPGQFRVGPLYLTPYLRIGNVGVDTNVFFTSEERRRDFSVSGGPGLDLVLPVKRRLRFLLGGGVEYLFFANETSQRRLTGSARGRVDWSGQRIHLGAEESYAKTFGRPSFEVDDRILQEQRQTRGDLRLSPGQGRFTVSGSFTFTRIDVSQGQAYLGSDLASALSRDEYWTVLELGYRLTPKTSLVVEGDHQQDRFRYDPGRDADSNRAAAGFRVASATRLSGKAVGGVRSFRPRAAAGAELLVPYAEVDLAYAFGRANRIDGHYHRDLAYSAFRPAEAPVLRTESVGFGLDQRIVKGLGLKLTGSLTRFESEGAIAVQLPDQGPVTAVRADKAWQGSADLGWQFRFKLRLGIGAFYVDRRSSISHFGVDGLAVGLTVAYTGTPAVTWRP